jgi:hypothetical protein
MDRRYTVWDGNSRVATLLKKPHAPHNAKAIRENASQFT